MSSYLETNVFEDRTESEFDLLEANYYKLPFCDEDLNGFPEPGHDWIEHNLEDELSYDVQYHHGLASPLSPSYCLSPSSLSSSSPNGRNQKEHSHLLLNERPDTPLMAVKFEDFSNDYGLNDLGYPTYDESACDDVQDSEMNIDDEIGLAEPLNLKCTNMESNDNQVVLPTGSERTMDYSLSSVVAPTFEGNATITISKAEDGSALIKPSTINDAKDDNVEFSFSRDQPVLSCVSTSTPQNMTLSSPTTSKPSQVYLCDQTPFIKTNLSKLGATSTNPQKPTLEELIEISDLITLPATQKIKVAPQAKITTNTFTHKTQIQIPTSTLQTILKNGRLVKRLQQDGQVLPKIHIKSESQPQLDLPPTPPSSTGSDTEGSSSPGSRGSGGPNSPIRPQTHIRVQPTSNHLAAQLLSSTQRFTQTHGPLILTEEEKRTLVAEGYSIPSKLPLSKSEEKSLKKIRRKIKNKLSAQESRRKKKEYVETLEKRMDVYNKENMDLKRKLDSLENSNRSLLSQLRSLQTLVAGKMPKPSRTVTTQTSSCLMMIVLCFAVLLGGWYPHLSPFSSTQYNSMTSQGNSPNFNDNWHSRILVSIKEDEGCHGNQHCYGHIEKENELMKKEDPIGELGDGGSDTYDEPTGGRVTMNDTGDQQSNIIANTMEPRTVADVIASRKVVLKNSKMEVVQGETPHDVTKKVVVSSQLLTE